MTTHLDLTNMLVRLATFKGRKRLVGVLADPGDLCEDCMQALFLALHDEVPGAEFN